MTVYPKISQAEWQVMKILWEKSPASADDVVDRISNSESWKPKTIKTLINRLVQKKAVGFTKQGRKYLYFPLFHENEIVREESRTFLDRFFGGALKPMIATMVENEDLSDKEIEELKALLDKASGKNDQD